jgi:hypothetical protein
MFVGFNRSLYIGTELWLHNVQFVSYMYLHRHLIICASNRLFVEFTSQRNLVYLATFDGNVEFITL